MNDVTLKEYLEALLNEREKRTNQLEQDAKEALNKASIALEKRLDLLNEFRAQAADEASKYARREDLDTLKERMDISQGGRAMLTATISVMLALVSIAVTFIR